MPSFRNASSEYRFAARHSALAVLIIGSLCCFAKTKVQIDIVYIYFQATLNTGTYNPPLRVFFRCYPKHLKIKSTVGWVITTAKTHFSRRS